VFGDDQLNQGRRCQGATYRVTLLCIPLTEPVAPEAAVASHIWSTNLGLTLANTWR
jgi:hypothetical protein